MSQSRVHGSPEFMGVGPRSFLLGSESCTSVELEEYNVPILHQVVPTLLSVLACTLEENKKHKYNDHNNKIFWEGGEGWGAAG